MADITVHSPEYLSEPDRATITANGIVVDVIANEDGSVYVEFYAYKSSREYGEQAVVQHAAINRYKDRHPNLRLEIANAREEVGESTETLEDLLNERLALLGDAIRGLRFPRNSLPPRVVPRTCGTIYTTNTLGGQDVCALPANHTGRHDWRSGEAEKEVAP